VLRHETPGRRGVSLFYGQEFAKNREIAIKKPISNLRINYLHHYTDLIRRSLEMVIVWARDGLAPALAVAEEKCRP
jgi:hypothetical protein